MLKQKSSGTKFLSGLLSLITAVGLCGWFFTPFAQASEDLPVRKAKLFDLKDRKTLLFNYDLETTLSGERRIVTSRYRDENGKLAAEETIELTKDGGKLLKYTTSQKQLGSEGSIELKDGKAKFSLTKDGETKTAEVPAGSDFVLGPSIVTYLQAHWDKLMKGETVPAQFAVMERLEAYGFRFSKEKDLEHNGKKAVVIRMEPSTWVLRRLVDPLHFTLAADGSKLFQIEGRAMVKREEKGKFKDLDALTVYE